MARRIIKTASNLRHMPTSSIQISPYNRSVGWVDISKGIVICLMVIGHSSLPSVLSRWIWSFHMPFFFLISALFTNWEKQPWSEFALRKGKILLIPFVVYSAINLIVYPFSLGISHTEFLRQIIMDGWGGIALWFVPVFYLSLILCRAVRELYLIPVGILLLIVGGLLSYNNILLPWTLSSVPFAAAMMVITRRFKRAIRSYFQDIDLTKLIITSMAGLLLSLVISHFWRLDMASNTITPVIPICLGVVGGTAFIICLSIEFDKFRIFQFFKHIGRNTYEIMALSQVTIGTLKLYFNHQPLLRYLLLIIILIIVTCLRRTIEGRFSKSSPI